MRALLAIALSVACDAGRPTAKPAATQSAENGTKPAQAPPATADASVTAPEDAAAATPSDGPHLIDWELGGLGTWKGNLVVGPMWRVVIDLDRKSMEITDPSGVKRSRKLTADAVATYTRLAKAMLAEPHSKPRNSCSDRQETLRVDTVSVSDSCPLEDPGAGALTGTISHELEKLGL